MTFGRPDTSTNLLPARFCFAQTLALLLLGLAPLPMGWGKVRDVLESTRSLELNRADRESSSAGYYEGLIGGGEGLQNGRNELALRLMGKPTEWVRFNAANVMNPLPDGDFLQNELKPNVRKMIFGQPFTTNSHGMRDREYTKEKPEGTFRIAVLGSSMDMGWGIGTEETYVNLLEDWLNAHAAKRGLNRRFEVLNFAVAAYSPLQRLEAYRRKAREFHPDMVIYSATMLDTRLMEIHLCDLFRGHSDLGFDFVRSTIVSAGLSDEDLRTDQEDRLVHKEIVKQKLRDKYWPLYDEALGELAAECRAENVALTCIIIPRVGKADAPAARAETVARLKGIAAHHAIPLFDLSGTFDGRDAARFEIASWDDHPNALGHHRLFLGLSRGLVGNPELYELMFLSRPNSTSTRGNLDSTD